MFRNWVYARLLNAVRASVSSRNSTSAMVRVGGRMICVQNGQRDTSQPNDRKASVSKFGRMTLSSIKPAQGVSQAVGRGKKRQGGNERNNILTGTHIAHQRHAATYPAEGAVLAKDLAEVVLGDLKRNVLDNDYRLAAFPLALKGLQPHALLLEVLLGLLDDVRLTQRHAHRNTAKQIISK